MITLYGHFLEILHHPNTVGCHLHLMPRDEPVKRRKKKSQTILLTSHRFRPSGVLWQMTDHKIAMVPGKEAIRRCISTNARK